jgi:SSS family solute:Na+ symporter
MIDLAAADHPFTLADWAVIVAYLVFTTLLGARLAGRPSTIRDFFLGGRKLPWWAICGSIVATEISAATIVGVPTISFKPGGNLTYLQLALGSILARVLVAVLLVKTYYEHEIYSPYDWVGGRLGPRVKHATTGLFFLGAILGQGARLFITASVLGVVADLDLVPAIWLMGAFGIGWTLLGGMVTVIWTDVIQFVVIFLGAVAALIAAVSAVPGGTEEILRLAQEAGKLTLFDASTDLSRDYTLWCGLLALPFLNFAAFGTDQVMAQRMFCCKSDADARRATLWSNAALIVPLLMLAVGIALHAYFVHQPMNPREAARYAADPTSVFPIFIVRALPLGLRGLVVAAIFAAAISTLASALAALAQATMSFFIKPAELGADAFVAAARPTRRVVQSKLWVIAWGVILCGMATACIEVARSYNNVIDLALSLVRYTYGPLLGIFLLALLTRRRDDSGLLWAVAVTITLVYGMSNHTRAADWITWCAAVAIALAAWAALAREPRRALTVTLAAGVALVMHHARLDTRPDGSAAYLSPYWHYPLATTMTVMIGYLVGRRKND